MIKNFFSSLSLKTRIISAIALIGLAIIIPSNFLMLFVKLNNSYISFLTSVTLITLLLLLSSIYLIIKEKQYWTNDPDVMSPLRKLSKIMFFTSIIILLLSAIFNLGGIFDYILIPIIFSWIFWKFKFGVGSVNNTNKWHNNSLNPGNSTGLNMRTTRNNNYRY